MSPGGGFAQPALTVAGAGALVLALVGFAWMRLDSRRLQGAPIALKPTKFALSIGVYLLTVSWMLGFARPERLSSPTVSGATWGLLAGAGVELFCIVLQAARGRRSHFNLETRGDAAISGLMGIVAVLFVGMLLPLAWEIGRRPRSDAAPLMTWAVVCGLVATFLLGGLSGAGMGRSASSSAAAVDRHDTRVAVLGSWVKGGPAWAAHALGVHALQAFPLMAGIGLLLQGWIAVALPAAGGLAYVAATLALISGATRPRPRPAPLVTL